ncbi:NAC domain-containing protein 1-like [Aristolochia californica]|uniref:NAC domain-containing protein 1-like n=1 Tax=Aristolochia californica TaxID=171875 RepID=UPI0035E27CCC
MTKGRQARGATPLRLPPQAPPLPPEQQQPILVPIGFQFNPTDLELVTYYLRKKLIGEDFPLSRIIIHEVNVYGYHMVTLAQTYPRANDNEWYFFTPRECKHVNGICPNRMVVNGFWKATGSLFKIVHQGQVVDSKRTLVFFERESKHGIKMNWIMH